MKKQSGFTLIELMVVLAIAVFIITSAVPGFQSFIQNNRMTTSTHQFITSINLARSEAVKRGQQVSMCISNNASTCTGVGTQGWAHGWIIFVDNDNDGQRDTAGTPEELIRVQNTLVGINSIDGETAVESVISYGDNGFVRPVGGGTFSKSTLVVCDSRDFGAHNKALIINTTGSIRTASASDSGISSCNV